MYNTNIYISQPNWGLHPLLFYCWLLRPCFLPFWYSLAFLFFPVLIACFQLYLPTFCTYKKSLVWLLSPIEFYSGHLIFMFCSCLPGADHAKSPCLTCLRILVLGPSTTPPILNWNGLCILVGLPRWHSGKESACQCRKCNRCSLDPWIRKIPWRRKWQSTPVFLPGKIPEGWWVIIYGVRHDWAHTHTHTLCMPISLSWYLAFTYLLSFSQL